MPYHNLAEMFFAQAERLGPQVRYRARREGSWVDETWAGCATRVRQLAAGLLTVGVQPGDRVALLCSTRAEWVEIDLAVLAIGAVTVPIYPSNLPDECGYILWNADATVAFVENEKQAAKIEQVRTQGFVLDGRPYRAAIQHLIVVDGSASGDLMTLDQLAARGHSASAAEIERRISALTREHLATIVYTSGTTGPPKGVMQTHGNHLAAVESISELRLAEPGEVDFAFLPLAHSFQRLVEYYAIFIGSTTAFGSIDSVLQDLRDTRPHVVPSVPRIFEKVYAGVQASRNEAGMVKRSLMDWAFATGYRINERQRANQPVPALLSLQAAIAHRLVYSKVHNLLGGRIKYLISGGAPLSKEIAEFFHAIGLKILEGYGLTETTPVLTVNRPDRYRLGTVGLPLSCVTLRLAEDGEILARGANVAQGYFKRPEATREAWDSEGWFHTGDIGEFDPDGFLRITDRKKDLIKTSGGKYVAPQIIENLMKTQSLISQAVVIGDNRKYCVALLTLDADDVKRWAAGRGLTLPVREEWNRTPAIQLAVEQAVSDVNARLASYEQVKYFRILPNDFSQETGELTPSLKVKRKVITERHRALIDEMYPA